MLSGGLVAVLYGATRGGQHGWGTASTLGPLAAGLAALAVYAVRATRRPDPVVGVAVVRHRASAAAVGLCVLAAVVMFTVIFLAPVLLQDAQHHSALATGLALLPQGLVTGLGTVLGQRLDQHTPLALSALLLCGRGLAVGLVIQPLLQATIAPLAGAELADANTVFNIAQRLGGSLGIGLLSALFAAQLRHGGPAAAVPAFHQAALILAGVAAAGLATTPLLAADQPRGRAVKAADPDLVDARRVERITRDDQPASGRSGFSRVRDR